MDDLGKKGTSSSLHQALSIISKPSVNSDRSYNSETLNSGQNWRFFCPCDLEIWRMTLKNNREPPPCYCKLCASFHYHRSIPTGGTVRKRQIWVEVGIFCPTWHWNLTNDHKNTKNRAATTSFVHYFVAICELKVELQFENPQSGSK